jgi:hypothetical protein
MAATQNDLSLTITWSDVVATYAALASASAFIQNKGPGPVLVYFSASGTAPTGSNGTLLRAGETTLGTAAHIWVRALNNDAEISPGLTD